MKRIFSILFIALMACSCTSETTIENTIISTPDEKDPTGYLYYQSDVNVLSRHQMIDGNFITGSVGLSYFSTPGAHDGDGGTDFVFKILNEEILGGKDEWIAFSSGDLEAYYIHWASPAGYDWQASDSMPGRFKIVEYIASNSLIMELDFNPEDAEKVSVKFVKSP